MVTKATNLTQNSLLALQNSVIVKPKVTDARYSSNNSASALFFNQILNAASEIESWNGDIKKRDRQLRELFLSETIIKAAIFSIASARAAFSWKIEGPPRTSKATQDMLHGSDGGNGWQSLMFKVAIDTLTQDNGGFLEIVRSQNNPDAAVVRLNHLDAARCQRTGDPENPVIYTDTDSVPHLLPWYSICLFEDMPHPLEEAYGRQICFLSRILEAVQIIRDIRILKHEKVSGRNPKSIHLVGGAKKSEIEDAKKNAQLNADNKGYTRYIEPIILASLDPTATVSHVQIDLAGFPDGFDESETLKWYIVEIAMAAGADYQDFAPLPGGNLGTSSQSEILHQKARAKGHTLWMKKWEHSIQFNNILPKNVLFKFEQIDTMAEIEQAQLKKTRADTRSVDITAGVVTIQVAQQQAADDGDLKEEYLAMMGEADVTPAITIPDDEKPEITSIVPASPVVSPIVSETVVIQDVDMKRFVVKWLSTQIQTHTLQQIKPISPYQIELFEHEFTNLLNHLGYKTITTVDFWNQSSNPIAFAANLANINLRDLFARLPKGVIITLKSDEHLEIKNGAEVSNYHIVNRKASSIDTVINWIPLQTKQFKPSLFNETYHTQPCVRCGNIVKIHDGEVIYKLFQGWKISCSKHRAIGLKGRLSDSQGTYHEQISNYRATLESLVKQALNNQISRSKFLTSMKLVCLSGLSLAFCLGANIPESELTVTDKHKILDQAQINLQSIDLFGKAIFDSEYYNSSNFDKALVRVSTLILTFTSVFALGRLR